ncbi:MAG: hypothetical protein JWO08_3159 [Verrucomicrobiaceae bacterium]|nr:hypothetical protein [Verrucomicrobiaceae bacterium]
MPRKAGEIRGKLRVEAVELGDEPSKGWDSLSTDSRLARMIFGAFGYGVGYVPVMGFLMPWRDLGMTELIRLTGLVGLTFCLLLTWLGVCRKRPFFFGAMLGLGIHAALIAWMWYGKLSR